MLRHNDYLITGGTGTLGKELISVFQQKSIPYSTASRTRPQRQENWLNLDLETGAGINEAVEGKKIILHLASSTKKISKNNDLVGTQKLLQAAKKNNISHFIYISIVGIDKVPLSYYQLKLQAEKEIINSGIPYTILRATQFHDFADNMLHNLLKFPLAIIPKKIKLQPIETKIVAQQLFTITQGQPLRKTINLGGKEILELEAMVNSWLQSQRKSKILFGLPLIGRTLHALKNGGLTCNKKSHESIRWEEWLKKKYNSS